MNDTEKIGSATYSPEDNKLRLYPDARLPKELYDRVKAAGFSWAPKQELFVAPMWTPQREDLLVELCGEIGDEDKSLVERAEERAERFEDYSESRKADAESARETVETICNGIPLGQPILVGHHSERHARKDAERIENGMRKAVKMWEQSQYWAARAKGSIRAAKYKERPDVRARRIKGIEADKRKQERNLDGYKLALRFWRGEMDAKGGGKFEITEERREKIVAVLGGIIGNTVGIHLPKKDGDTMDSASAYSCLSNSYPSLYVPRTVAEVQAHAIQAFERLVESANRWLAHYENRLTYERAMLEADGGTATDRKGPEKGGAVKCWASPRGGWSYIQKVNKVSVTVLDNWGNGGANFTRTIPFDKCFHVLSAAEVSELKASGRLIEDSHKTGFFVAGEPVKPEPKKAEAKENPIEAMKETLKAGVQVVTSNNLFPTPLHVINQMIEAADLVAGDKLLEPSAGLGGIVQEAIRNGVFMTDCVLVDNSFDLTRALSARFPRAKVVTKDFLKCNGDIGAFNKILMNPPFDHGSDIKHIKHALSFLEPGGRLVAICANGPRQQEELKPLASDWIDLPEGTFKDQGTNVNTALLVIEK